MANKKGKSKTKKQSHTHTTSAEAHADVSHENKFESAEAQAESAHDSRKKPRIDFYGSEILREKAPKAFALAEAIAEEWVNDGKFHALPVGHPLAQLAASVGLQTAKKVEKKLEEKGVFSLAKMSFEMAKAKLPANLREKFTSKTN